MSSEPGLSMQKLFPSDFRLQLPQPSSSHQTYGKHEEEEAMPCCHWEDIFQAPEVPDRERPRKR